MATKKARKVALIDLRDYPKEKFSAYWEIYVDEIDPEGDGYAWRARLMSYEPIGWMHEGKRHDERPAVPLPVYPADIAVDQVTYLGMKPIEQQAVRQMQEDRRRRIAEIYEASPQPVYEIATEAGIAKGRDEADTAAQTWVKAQMAAYKRTAPPANPQAGYALTLGPLDMIRELFERLFGWLFALAYSTTIRHNRLHAVRDAIDGGAGAGLLRFYDGTRPATGGTATTLLAELTFSDPSAGAASGGSLTFSSITQDSSANATGTATWFRCVDSTGTFCVDGNVGTSGSDLNLNSTSINTGVAVSVSSFVLTEGNP